MNLRFCTAPPVRTGLGRRPASSSDDEVARPPRPGTPWTPRRAPSPMEFAVPESPGPEMALLRRGVGGLALAEDPSNDSPQPSGADTLNLGAAPKKPPPEGNHKRSHDPSPCRVKKRLLGGELRKGVGAT